MAEVDAVMLARLIAQAEGEGSARVTLRALVEEASAMGAERALARLGLGDAGAGGDVRELRELLGAWRDAKRSAWREVQAWIVRLLLAALVVGIAVRAGLAERLA